MLQQLILKNFRNFQHKEVFFDEKNNLIVGENGSGKTNILEAISLLCGKNILSLDMDDLVCQSETTFYIEGLFSGEKRIAISYDKVEKKKKILYGGKATTISKIKTLGESSVVFQPIDMNMMYLSPSLRRNYIDGTLSSVYSEYDSLLKSYKNILRNRNSILKRISEGKVPRTEISFWDTSFLQASQKIYGYIIDFTEYIQANISEETKDYFFGKIGDISFQYITKTNLHNIEESMRSYLEKNFERDIILGSTHIGPHIDDFEIRIDDKLLQSFASRGETKSVMMGLKMIETGYIQKKRGSFPIVLIDDFLSEIDEKHRNSILKKISGMQTIVSSIDTLNFDNTIYL